MRSTIHYSLFTIHFLPSGGRPHGDRRRPPLGGEDRGRGGTHRRRCHEGPLRAHRRLVPAELPRGADARYAGHRPQDSMVRRTVGQPCRTEHPPGRRQHRRRCHRPLLQRGRGRVRPRLHEDTETPYRPHGHQRGRHPPLCRHHQRTEHQPVTLPLVAHRDRRQLHRTAHERLRHREQVL